MRANPIKTSRLWQNNRECAFKRLLGGLFKFFPQFHKLFTDTRSLLDMADWLSYWSWQRRPNYKRTYRYLLVTGLRLFLNRSFKNSVSKKSLLHFKRCCHVPNFQRNVSSFQRRGRTEEQIEALRRNISVFDSKTTVAPHNGTMCMKPYLVPIFLIDQPIATPQIEPCAISFSYSIWKIRQSYQKTWKTTKKGTYEGRGGMNC